MDVTNILLRVSDSFAFVCAPRHVFGVVDDTENNRKLVVRAKNNLSPAEQKRKSLAFHFDAKQVGTDPRNGKPIVAPFIVWEPGYVDISATEALAALSANKSPSQLEDAKRFLHDTLTASEGRAPGTDIEEAAEWYFQADSVAGQEGAHDTDGEGPRFGGWKVVLDFARELRAGQRRGLLGSCEVSMNSSTSMRPRQPEPDHSPYVRAAALICDVRHTLTGYPIVKHSTEL